MGGFSSRPQAAPPPPPPPGVSTVEAAIQRALANESTTILRISTFIEDRTPLTVNDAQRIIACLENPRFDTLTIYKYDVHDASVLNVFRNGLPLCTSVTTVRVDNLTNEDLDRLRPAFHNTSITKLDLTGNDIQGRRGGEVLRDLLVGNDTLRELIWRYNHFFGPEGAIGFGQGLADNHGLQILNLERCFIGNEGLANLLPAEGIINNSLTSLDLRWNDIEGEEGGRQLTLLLQCFPTIKVLCLYNNNCLGPLGARALAPGLAAASHLKELNLCKCGLGNDGVANLIPEGQVNRSLTILELGGNDIQGLEGGENVIALVAHCTNLDHLFVDENILIPHQRGRLHFLLDRKRLCTQVQALAGSPFPVLFRAVENAHRHEHGLSAIFVILQNDGDDYFCTALNRAME